MTSTGRRSPIERAVAREDRMNGGNGSNRSPLLFGVFGALLVAGAVATSAAHAQLEVLLRGVEATQPQAGRCGRYRFEAEEPSGKRAVEFDACIESVSEGGHGTVILHLWSGDSLDARVEVRHEMFEGGGGTLLEHVIAVEQTENGEVRRLTSESWRDLPALSPAPELPVLRDSTLAMLQHVPTGLTCPGRLLEEGRSSRRQMGSARVTQTESRVLRVWTATEAPILGVVRATAYVRSERQFSEPIPGVPERGPRESRYSLELLEFHRTATDAPDKSSR